jgi:hypothetical protein
MNVPLPTTETSSWPLLKIDFEALRDEKFEGDFEVQSFTNTCYIFITDV